MNWNAIVFLVLPVLAQAAPGKQLPPAPNGVAHVAARYQYQPLPGDFGIVLPETYVFNAAGTELYQNNLAPDWLREAIAGPAAAKSKETREKIKLTLKMLRESKREPSSLRTSTARETLLKRYQDQADRTIVEFEIAELWDADLWPLTPPPTSNASLTRNKKTYAQISARSVNAEGKALAPPPIGPNQLLVVQFWATWCAPCITEGERLVAAFAKRAPNEIIWWTIDATDGGFFVPPRK